MKFPETHPNKEIVFNGKEEIELISLIFKSKISRANEGHIVDRSRINGVDRSLADLDPDTVEEFTVSVNPSDGTYFSNPAREFAEECLEDSRETDIFALRNFFQDLAVRSLRIADEIDIHTGHTALRQKMIG